MNRPNWARLSVLWRTVAIFGAILAAVLLFLMIRNWISTGNPLHAKSSLAVTPPPVKIGFSPATIHAGESYTMIMPQPIGEWAGQWVDMRVACDDDKPAEVLHFKQLDSQGQVRVTVDPTFRACQVKVSGVRRSGDRDWHDATGSITVQR